MKRRFLALALIITLPLGSQTTGLEPGIAHFNARRWSDAQASFAAIAKAQPKSADAAFWMGRTLMAEEKPADAEEWFDKASQLEPRSSDYQLWLARAIGMHALRANVLRQPFLARRIKAAVDKSIALDPNNIDAREMRWQFYSMAPGIMGGGDDKAREEAAQIMRRNRYRGQFVALQMAGKAKDNAAVERTLMAMVAEFPDSIGAVSSYSSWLSDKGRGSEAFVLIEVFQKRHPNDLGALYQVGRIAAVTGQQLDRGEEAFKKYMTLSPAPSDGSNAHFRLGNIQEKRGDKVGARAEYELAVRLDSRNLAAKRALAALK